MMRTWLSIALSLALAGQAEIASAAPQGDASESVTRDWRPAAELALAEMAAGRSVTASAWYWAATDAGDYSEAYLAWQEQALARIFEGRPAVTLELTEPAKTIHVDGIPLPNEGVDRPLALDPGKHSIVATSQSGGSFQGSIDIEPGGAEDRTFFKISFLPKGYVDPRFAGPATEPRPRVESSMSAFQIVTVISTVALASGIAIGGGYLLFGSENPRGLDTPEGAAIISVELLLIGGGTTIALLSD